jgi:hypothetical protein
MAVMRMFRPARVPTVSAMPEGAAGAPAPPADAGAAPTTVAAAAPAPATTEVEATWEFTAASIIAVVVGWLAVLGLHGLQPANFPMPLKVSGDVATFALFYVAAQAIERAIEPFSNLILRTDTVKKQLDSFVATALASGSQTDGENAAKKQDELNKKRGERALALWAVATILGILLSGFTGLYFVNAILSKDSDFSRPLDVLITGLVIGGGSKPLHDLITNVQKTKEQREDPPETNPSQ